MTTDTAASAAPKTPYVGPRPYERADAAVFFGRSGEADELMCRIIANPEVLFYSQSGAGKTSLINARLIPQLEDEGCEILPTVRIRQLVPGLRPGAVKNLFAFHTLMSWTRGEEPDRLACLPLAEYLKERKGDDNHPNLRVAI